MLGFFPPFHCSINLLYTIITIIILIFFYFFLIPFSSFKFLSFLFLLIFLFLFISLYYCFPILFCFIFIFLSFLLFISSFYSHSLCYSPFRNLCVRTKGNEFYRSPGSAARGVTGVRNNMIIIGHLYRPRGGEGSRCPKQYGPDRSGKRIERPN